MEFLINFNIILFRRFYLTRETVNNNKCKIVTNKQKKTIELVHNILLLISWVKENHSNVGITITPVLDTVDTQYNLKAC